MRIRLNGLLASFGLLLTAGLAAAQEPISVYQQNASPTQPAPAVSGGSLTLADVHGVLVGLNLAPYQLPGIDNMWLVDINRDGAKVPVAFTLSTDNSRIWIKSCVAQVEPGKLPPWQKMIELQESIKPVMFSYRGNSHELLVRYSIANVSVKSDRLKAAIDHYLEALMSVRGAWDSQRWTAANGNGSAIAAPVPYTANMPVAPAQPETVMKAVHDHLARVRAAAQEFLDDSDAFENGKPIASEKLIFDLATARRRIGIVLSDLDNLPTSNDAETRDYVNAYRTFARAFLTTVDGALIDCEVKMVSYLDSPRPGQTRETVKAEMRETAAKAAVLILPASKDFTAAESHFRQHFNLVAAN